MGKAYGTPGPRSIYPDLCDSRSMSRCSILANALWPRLIVQADDQGRLHGDAHDIRGLCFPKMDVTAAEVDGALDELAHAGSLRRYDRRGEPYIQLVEWWAYQSFGRRAYPSRYPAPVGWKDIIYGVEGAPATYKLALPPNAAPRRDTRQKTAAKRGKTPPTLVDPTPSNPVPSDPSRPRSTARQNAASGRSQNETGDGKLKAELEAHGLSLARPA